MVSRCQTQGTNKENWQKTGTQGNFGKEERSPLGVPRLKLNIRNITRSMVERKEPGINAANQTDIQTE